jgi:hypothetical protein
MICGTNPNIVIEAAAIPTIVHNIDLSFYSFLSLRVLRVIFSISSLWPIAS